MRDSDIKKFRKDHNLTQEDLAEIVGVKVGTVQSWEQGKRNIGRSAIKLLHDYVRKKEERVEENERFENLVAKKVAEILFPVLEGYTDNIVKAAMNMHLTLNDLKIRQEEILEAQKECNEDHSKTKEILEAIEKKF